MVRIALEKKLSRYLIGIFLISIFFGCENKKVPTVAVGKTQKLIQSNLPDSIMFRQSLGSHDSILKAEVNRYVKTWLTANNDSAIRGVPILSFSDTLVEISYLMNKSELYYCVFSYYSLLNEEIPVLVYDNDSGYLNLETGDYSIEFFNRVAPYLNDDMTGTRFSDIVEIDGEERSIDGWKFENNPITYNPRVMLFEVNADGIKALNSEFESPLTHNCNFNIELENRYQEIGLE